MNSFLPFIQKNLQIALDLIKAGNVATARDLLNGLAQNHPQVAGVHWLLAGIHLQQGDFDNCQRELSATLQLDPNHASAHALLGEIHSHAGRIVEAEECFRHALRLQPNHLPAAINLAYILLSQGHPDAALETVQPFLDRGLQDPALLMLEGQTTLARRDPTSAARTFERLLQITPDSIDGRIGYASALADVGQHERAVELMRECIGGGTGKPEAHFVLAHALLNGGDKDGAITEFRKAIRARPNYLAAHLTLCELVWMQTEDVHAASTELDATLRHFPDLTPIRILKAKLLETVGDLESAITTLEDGLTTGTGIAELNLAIAQAAIKSAPRKALICAERALAFSPENEPAQIAYCGALLGSGRPEEAGRVAEKLHGRQPNDCHVLALQACAWRLLGDPRYQQLYDYRFVLPQTIDVPHGWPSLPAYLTDLRAGLSALHGFKAHPVNQSLRLGTQADLDFAHVQDAAVRAFPQAIDGPIRRYIEQLGHGVDEFRRRNNGRYRLNGAWSVRLRSQGFHVNHIHPDGWLSSACYIELPEVMSPGNDAGWIQFGQPGFITTPALSPEHQVQPQPGMLVLFPSYMWHGTVPFSAPPSSRRMTIAFDVVPD